MVRRRAAPRKRDPNRNSGLPHHPDHSGVPGQSDAARRPGPGRSLPRAIGQVLLEHTVYDARSGRLLSGSYGLRDAAPTSASVRHGDQRGFRRRRTRSGCVENLRAVRPYFGAQRGLRCWGSASQSARYARGGTLTARSKRDGGKEGPTSGSGHKRTSHQPQDRATSNSEAVRNDVLPRARRRAGLAGNPPVPNPRPEPGGHSGATAGRRRREAPARGTGIAKGSMAWWRWSHPSRLPLPPIRNSLGKKMLRAAYIIPGSHGSAIHQVGIRRSTCGERRRSDGRWDVLPPRGSHPCVSSDSLSDRDASLSRDRQGRAQRGP